MARVRFGSTGATQDASVDIQGQSADAVRVTVRVPSRDRDDPVVIDLTRDEAKQVAFKIMGHLLG